MKYQDTVILVFAKAPVAGQVNTRLIPDIGIEAATCLQETLIHQRLASLQLAGLCDVILMCSPDDSHAVFRDCEQRYSVILLTQQGEGLGERIAGGVRQIFSGGYLADYRRVIVMGTDAPALTAVRVEQAIQCLTVNDLVAVPAEDGGYVLLGQSGFYPQLYHDIDWGSDRVMQQTRRQANALGLQLGEMPECWDIDREQDYRRYLQWLKTAGL